MWSLSKKLSLQKHHEPLSGALVEIPDVRKPNNNIQYSLALMAAELSYALKRPLADSIIFATARAHNATLWTQDAHVQGLEDVKYMPKP